MVGVQFLFVIFLRLMCVSIGSTWGLLSPPLLDSNKQPYECSDTVRLYFVSSFFFSF